MKRSIALALVLALLSVALVGCDPCALLYGSWVNSNETIVYAFGQDGVGVTSYMDFPLEFTYTYEDGLLTVYYSEEIKEEGRITFYGDYEFVWEGENEDGTTFQEYYSKKMQ